MIRPATAGHALERRHATIERLAGVAPGAPADPSGVGPLEPRAIPVHAPGTPPHAPATPPGRPAFAAELTAAAEERSVRLSGHALRRLEQRRIDLEPAHLDRLRSALDQLEAKGGRQSLVMLDQVAYVVHVPSQTVVTAVAPGDRKEAVFTNVDSVVIA